LAEEVSIMSDRDLGRHIGHRERVRLRFLSDGDLDNFEYHQVLELLLFYSVKLQDTNELAHRLIDCYGSFHKLLEASPKDIVKKCNVSETTAMLISAIPHIFKMYNKSKLFETYIIKSVKTACRYFKMAVVRKNVENLAVVYLDINKKVIRFVNINDENNQGNDMPIDLITDLAMLYKCIYVIIGHNVLGENIRHKPNIYDIKFTSMVKGSLESVGVALMDYLILYEDGGYYSFAENRFCELKYYD